MAGPTLTQRVNELKDSLNELAADLAKYKAINESGKSVTNDKLAELNSLTQRIHEKVIEQMAKLAALEERAKALEKGTDRFWQFAPMVISVAGVVVSLVIALSKK